MIEWIMRQWIETWLVDIPFKWVSKKIDPTTSEDIWW